MNTFLESVSDLIRESVGIPVRLRRLLDDRPDFKAQLLTLENNIDMARVPKWQRINDCGSGVIGRRNQKAELLGWRTRDNQYSSFTQRCPALLNMVRQVKIDAWSCDLQDLHGFAASKSKLATFRSMDEMVETNSHEMIQNVSLQGLRKNLAHNEIRLLREKPTDWLQTHQWDKRMFVVNSGGSHHLAAAKYIATRIGAPVPLCAPLVYYSIDLDAVMQLRSGYDIYLVSEKSDLANAFSDAMKSCGATWLSHDLPLPYEKTRAIFLPRGETRSMRVSQAFREARFAELGQYLEDAARSGMPEVIQRRLNSQYPAAAEVDDGSNNSGPRG